MNFWCFIWMLSPVLLGLCMLQESGWVINRTQVLKHTSADSVFIQHCPPSFWHILNPKHPFTLCVLMVAQTKINTTGHWWISSIRIHIGISSPRPSRLLRVTGPSFNIFTFKPMQVNLCSNCPLVSLLYDTCQNLVIDKISSNAWHSLFFSPPGPDLSAPDMSSAVFNQFEPV